jgi:uncharacterized repeat protein (TIGR01451 family)
LTTPITKTPSISIQKTRATSTTATLDAVGQVVHYNIAVKNTGNVTLHTVAVTDTQSVAGEQLTSGPTCPSATLAPGATETCTATYTLTQTDLDNGYVQDTAKATAKTPGTKSVTATSTALRVTTTRRATISLTISVIPGSYSKVGTVLRYTFVVTNTGNVLLQPVILTDPMEGLSPISCPVTSLAPGKSETCTATYSVTAQDIAAGVIQTTAVVTGTSVHAQAVQATASISVLTAAVPAITVTKSASQESVAAVGQTVNYKFLVKNTGDVTVHTVKVTDIQSVAGEALTSGPTCPAATLAPGASETCTATYTVTAVDMAAGEITDTATASAISPHGTAVTSPASSVTVVADHTTSIISGANGRRRGDVPLEIGGITVLLLGAASLVLGALRRRTHTPSE